MAAERNEGWTGQVAMLLTAFFPATGLRPSELRLANLEDLELRNWTFRVRHPKGERSYGRQRMVLVLPPAHEAVKRFLKERRKKLDNMGAEECVALIPAFHGRGKAGFYAPTRFREIKRKVQLLVNVDPGGEKTDFHIKTFRDTYCQMCIDRDASKLSAISVTMGHATTRTTEEHYGRMRETKALEQVRGLWAEETLPKVYTPLIETKFDSTGYA